MKKAKRILAGALAALILTMSLPLSALADEADVPVESPSFEVAFDVDTGQEEISEDPPADIEATPEPTPEPTAEPTQEPTPTPESTATPAPTAEPTAVPTATPGVTATPTAVPTSTPEPSAVPSASPVVTPTPTPTPSPQPVVNPVKLEHDVLDNVDKDCIYLFPVPNSSEITQEYSAEHKAIDIAALSGSPVYAAEDGTVSYVQIWDGSYDTTGMMSYGHMVEVRHADGNTTLYDATRPCDIYSKDTLGVIQNDPRYNFPNNEDYKLANIPQKQLAHNYQTASATVDGNDVTMLDDEMDAGSTNAIAPLQVVNTRGFETPMTGENGTWALAIGGVLVFCLGTSAFIFFLVFKRRKEQEDK